MHKTGITLTILKGTFSVCRLSSSDAIPDWATQGSFLSVTRRQDELSIVCESVYVPENIEVESDWRALEVQGPLDFAMTGILASLAQPLARAGIPIFVISTFETDVLFVKQGAFDETCSVLLSEDVRIVT